MRACVPIQLSVKIKIHTGVRCFEEGIGRTCLTEPKGS